MPLIPSTCNAVQELKCADVLAKLLRLWPKAGGREEPTHSRQWAQKPMGVSLPVAAFGFQWAGGTGRWSLISGTSCSDRAKTADEWAPRRSSCVVIFLLLGPLKNMLLNLLEISQLVKGFGLYFILFLRISYYVNRNWRAYLVKPLCSL